MLTSAGVSNNSIHRALIDLLDKPIVAACALFVSTAAHAIPGGAHEVWRQARAWGDLGWESFGVLEPTPMPSSGQEHWLPSLQAADALLIGGGDQFYLSYWMWQSGLATILADLLHDKVYGGASAGSMVVTRTFGEAYDGANPPIGNDKTLGLVDFALYPHLDADYAPEASLVNLEKWAAGIASPAYVIDDQSAIIVRNDVVEVVSEGHWKLFNPAT
jgi:dipeptidase E